MSRLDGRGGWLASLLASTLGLTAGSRRRRRLVGTLVALGLAGFGLAMLAHGNLDADESQHLHIAWLIGQGRVPYADFWEHHMPLAHYALAPLTGWLADDPAIYFVARAIMAGAGAAALALVYVLGGRLGLGVGAAAVLLLGVQVRFLEYVVQVRPDPLALVTWLTAVLMLVRWRESERSLPLWVAGLALGLTAAITPKAAPLGLGAALVVAVSPCRASSLPCIVRRLACLATGCAVPLLGVLAWLAAAGGARALQAFVEDAIVVNLRFPDFIKQIGLGAEGAGFMALGLAGVGITLRRHGWRALRHPVHGPLLLPAAVETAILLLPSTPAVYDYTWLPVIVVGAIYAGLALVAIVEWARADAGTPARALLALVVLGAIVAPLVVTAARTFPSNRNNAIQLERMRRELAYACPGEAVLDARALAVFRPTALRYPSLVRGLRNWIKEGVVSPELLVQDLRVARAPVGLADSRLDIAGGVAAFIAKYYVREPDGLLVAGAVITLPGGAGEANVDLLVPGLYEISTPADARILVDGVAPTQPLVRLREGVHRISWDGAPGTLRFSIAPCAQRRASV